MRAKQWAAVAALFLLGTATAEASILGGLGSRLGETLGGLLPWLGIAIVVGLVIIPTRGIGSAMKVPLVVLAAYLVCAAIYIVAPFVPWWVRGIVAIGVAGGLWVWLDRLALFKLAKHANQATKNGGQDTLHGSARWGATQDMADHSHLADGTAAALALGRVAGLNQHGIDNRFWHTGHIVTCAPTGAGKGVGAVIPNLLTYPGSALVLDIKGENAAVTAAARRSMGHAVHVVDPFGIVPGETPSGFNLLDLIDPKDPDCVGESAQLADFLVIPEKPGESNHFDESARSLIQGLILHVAAVAQPGDRHIGEVRRLLTVGEDDLLDVFAEMATDESAAFGIPARAANTIMGTADRERGSILSTARKNTAFLDDPRIAAALSRSDFRFADLKRQRMTVYIALPANRLRANTRFLRGFVGAALSAIMATPENPEHRVLFVLDEFGQLGRMATLEDNISLVRGYGLMLWLFVQDLSQLKGVYPRWQTFLANASKQFFGTDDYDTAKYISDSMGKATVEFRTESTSKNQGGNLSGSGGGLNRGQGSGQNQQFTGRELLMPDEVMALGPKRPILLLSGEPPYQVERLTYHDDADYAPLAAANPYVA